MRKIGRLLAGASLAAACAASLLISGAALAGEKVGVAAAVRPEATSQPPGGDITTLKIGKSVVYNERIETSDSGQVQVLLLDGSTFTVGPGSSLVIDKFVYNPRSGTGTLAASLTKGALRFVGGKLSKNEPGVAIKTPAGALTVRGGIALLKVDSPSQAKFIFVYGKHLTLLRAGKLSKLTSAGQMFAISGGALIVKDATLAETNAILAALNGKSWKKLAATRTKGKGWPKYYGIQPTGKYTDEPFVRELYYNGATTQLLLSGAKPVKIPEPPPPPPPPPPPDINLPVTGPGCGLACNLP